jgi:hypothetical protein
VPSLASFPAMMQRDRRREGLRKCRAALADRSLRPGVHREIEAGDRMPSLDTYQRNSLRAVWVGLAGSVLRRGGPSCDENTPPRALLRTDGQRVDLKPSMPSQCLKEQRNVARRVDRMVGGLDSSPRPSGRGRQEGPSPGPSFGLGVIPWRVGN